MVQLSLEAVRGDEPTLRPLELPVSHRAGWPEDVVPGNVARVYAAPFDCDLHPLSAVDYITCSRAV
jgi:hypothetical protein